MRWPSTLRPRRGPPMRNRLASTCFMAAEKWSGSPVWNPRAQGSVRANGLRERPGQLKGGARLNGRCVCTTRRGPTAQAFQMISARYLPGAGPDLGSAGESAKTSTPSIKKTDRGKYAAALGGRGLIVSFSSCGGVPGFRIGVRWHSRRLVVYSRVKRTGLDCGAREAGNGSACGREQGLLCGRNPTLPQQGEGCFRPMH